MPNKKVIPLLTVFSLTVGGKCFRVYDHVPPGRWTRFIMDDLFHYKTHWPKKREWFKMLRNTINEQGISFDTIMEYCNLKLTEAIKLFKEED